MINKFISSDSFATPQYLAPSAWVEHIPFAFELINKLRPAVIVELGVFHGVSYFSFCQAVQASELSSTCYGIDSWYGDEHASFLNEDVFEKVSSYNHENYAAFSHLIRSEFSAALNSFGDKSIDLLHIDGLHTYEAVKNDFETWLPKLSDSSIVLFHDISVKDRGFGVFQLWEELSAIYPSFSFVHGYGLGVLATGKNISPEILPLIQSTEKGVEELRTIYQQLGLAVTQKIKTEEIQSLQSQLQTLQARIPQLQEEVETLGAWGRRSAEESESAQKRIAQLQQDNENKSNQLYRMQSEKDDLQTILQDVYSSDGYRLLSIYYRIKAKLLPENSPRHLKLKAFGKYLKSRKAFTKLRTKIPAVSVSPLAKDPDRIPEVPANISFPLAFPIFDQPIVSIIIPAYNNWLFTRNCIISIYQHTNGIPYEIIVGDNVSTDETVNFEKYFTNINYLRNPENLGYIRNINNAASHARGQFILTLNNDTTVTENWLSSMLDVMNRDDKAGLVGSKLVFPDGTLQEAGGIIWNDASGWNYGRGADPEAPEYNYLKEADYISGASNLIRKDLWDKLKGLDERYVPAYFDDSDLAFSIRELGYKTILQPLSVVIHYEGLTHGTNTGTGTKKYQVINAEKFKEKWQATLAKEQFANAVDVFHARDRSRNRKTIVVIDHYVPTFDKDAGSRTTYQVLQLFVKNNYNVKFIGDNFYKMEPYTTQLQQMGIEVLYGEYYRLNWQDWIIKNKDYIDFFYINRPHISIKYIDFIKRKTDAKVIYYGHDLHFVREQLQYEIEKDPKLLESAKEWKKKETKLIQKSDIVLTLSYKEKEIIENEIGHTDIRIMPAFSYSRFNEPILNFEARRDLLFVGGFEHKPNVDAVVWFVKEVFPLITRQLKDVRFIIAGSKPPEEVTKLASDKIHVLGYISDDDLNKLYGNIKLVIIPLRYGAGVKGKTVETMYHGVPFVTTSFGIEGLKDIREITHSEDIAAPFAARVIELYSDDMKLKEMSSKEIEYAKKYFSKDSVTDIILKAFA
jgi:GT2 family glycosyltransferase